MGQGDFLGQRGFNTGGSARIGIDALVLSNSHIATVGNKGHGSWPGPAGFDRGGSTHHRLCMTHLLMLRLHASLCVRRACWASTAPAGMGLQTLMRTRTVALHAAQHAAQLLWRAGAPRGSTPATQAPQPCWPHMASPYLTLPCLPVLSVGFFPAPQQPRRPGATAGAGQGGPSAAQQQAQRPSAAYSGAGVGGQEQFSLTTPQVGMPHARMLWLGYRAWALAGVPERALLGPFAAHCPWLAGDG